MKLRHHRFSGLAAAAITMVAFGSVRADTVLLDPDGSGTAPKVSLNYFQFGAGNCLYQGLIPFTTGNNFQLLFQAQLNSVVSSSGVPMTPAGLNASTAVGGIAPYEI